MKPAVTNGVTAVSGHEHTAGADRSCSGPQRSSCFSRTAISSLSMEAEHSQKQAQRSDQLLNRPATKAAACESAGDTWPSIWALNAQKVLSMHGSGETGSRDKRVQARTCDGHPSFQDHAAGIGLRATGFERTLSTPKPGPPKPALYWATALDSTFYSRV